MLLRQLHLHIRGKWMFSILEFWRTRSADAKDRVDEWKAYGDAVKATDWQKRLDQYTEYLTGEESKLTSHEESTQRTGTLQRYQERKAEMELELGRELGGKEFVEMFRQEFSLVTHPSH